MTRNGYALATAMLAVGLAATACGNSPESSTTVTETVPASTTSATVEASATTSSAGAPTTASADLQSLIATPANSQRTDGPEPIQESGIHLHFLVNGAPLEVMDAYKTALEGKGWSLTVERSGGGGGGGGATYTGTNGGSYGVFVGGGYGGTTDVNSCAWPSKPSNTNCGSNN
jgi:hypothetical protein